MRSDPLKDHLAAVLKQFSYWPCPARMVFKTRGLYPQVCQGAPSHSGE